MNINWNNSFAALLRAYSNTGVPTAGLTLSWQISKNGAAFSAIVPTSVSDLGNGWYSATFPSSAADTLGQVTLYATSTTYEGSWSATVVNNSTSGDIDRDTATGLSIVSNLYTGTTLGNAINLSACLGTSFEFLSINPTAVNPGSEIRIQEAPAGTLSGGTWYNIATYPLTTGSPLVLQRSIVRTRDLVRAMLYLPPTPSSVSVYASAFLGAFLSADANIAAIADAVNRWVNPAVASLGANTPAKVQRLMDAVFGGSQLKYDGTHLSLPVKKVDFQQVHDDNSTETVLTLYQNASSGYTREAADWGGL